MQAEIGSQRDLGALIRTIRERHGYTQRELAAALGTTQRYIFEIEKGLPKRVDDNFYALLGKLGISLIAEVADD
ncbi:helix-turn-helix transcriptional regulator [Microcella sp.]|uniref:helix-turn-helix domain-containing protein n=1 Tax=Microcella sp. TaxID=1913979 RepID=UPI00299F5670|nr:helix-turn-helix transcriptional regulator [Microcella sp.]MDX2026825.1 helix-turn-helix transcriptional regulator [Microcella sp.]